MFAETFSHGSTKSRYVPKTPKIRLHMHSPLAIHKKAASETIFPTPLNAKSPPSLNAAVWEQYKTEWTLGQCSFDTSSDSGGASPT